MKLLLNPELTFSLWQKTHSLKLSRGPGVRHWESLSKTLSGRGAGGAWGCMRNLGSAYYSDSSLASPLLPSLSPAPHACVVHMSLRRCQGLADNDCFTAKHTCFSQPAKPFNCWLLGWMLISLQTSCLHSFYFHGRKNPFSLSHSFPPLPFQSLFFTPFLLPLHLSFQLEFVLIL